MEFASSGYHSELTTVPSEISRLESRLTNLYEALETRKLGLDDLAPRIKDLRSRQEQLQMRRIELEAMLSDQRVEIADKKLVNEYVDDLRRVLSESPLTERKAFVKSFVKEVRVQDNQATIEYTLPLLPQNLEREKMGVLPIVHHGGRYWT